MDTWSILIGLLVFLFFFQVVVRISKKSPLNKSSADERIDLLIEKFERLERAFKYEISDIAKSVSNLQSLYASASPSQEVISRLERIESALISLGAVVKPIADEQQIKK